MFRWEGQIRHRTATITTPTLWGITRSHLESTSLLVRNGSWLRFYDPAKMAVSTFTARLFTYRAGQERGVSHVAVKRADHEARTGSFEHARRGTSQGRQLGFPRLWAWMSRSVSSRGSRCCDQDKLTETRSRRTVESWCHHSLACDLSTVSFEECGYHGSLPSFAGPDHI